MALLTDLPAIIPANVEVLFPTLNGNVPLIVQVTLTSLNLPEFAGVATHPNTHVIRAATVYDPGGPAYYGFASTPAAATAAQADMLAFAKQAAADWYLWQLGKLDMVFGGMAQWTPDGLYSIEWMHVGLANTPGAKCLTRVQREEWNGLTEIEPYTTSDTLESVQVPDGPSAYYLNGKYLGFLEITDPHTNLVTKTERIWVQMGNGTFNDIIGGGALSQDVPLIKTHYLAKKIGVELYDGLAVYRVDNYGPPWIILSWQTSPRVPGIAYNEVGVNSGLRFPDVYADVLLQTRRTYCTGNWFQEGPFIALDYSGAEAGTPYPDWTQVDFVAAVNGTSGLLNVIDGPTDPVNTNYRPLIPMDLATASAMGVTGATYGLVFGVNSASVEVFGDSASNLYAGIFTLGGIIRFVIYGKSGDPNGIHYSIGHIDPITGLGAVIDGLTTTNWCGDKFTGGIITTVGAGPSQTTFNVLADAWAVARGGITGTFGG